MRKYQKLYLDFKLGAFLSLKASFTYAEDNISEVELNLKKWMHELIHELKDAWKTNIFKNEKSIELS